ncbi:SdrD B-like domain-containing protein [Amycolatopsis mongoliensis]|uniref:SdrD B-like domain-containing protein n=1 Tax=Amycolatopsis mongoliensis TaxID=715475 RepID=A0A9Y2JSC0_9PSEU|nr:SdrD B-like domain-containing protein [Amycolatopsis sp. 4-36]WIY03793.1 SdrD B-like domain-containing protein [Amycolatopsis sp. 4-36]
MPSSAAESAPPTEQKPRAAAERAEVDVSADFDKPSYGTGDDVTFKFKLTNVGQTRAAGLTIYQMISNPDDLNVPYDGWGPLKAAPGLSLEPGETFELPVSGRVRSLDKPTAVVRGVLFDETGASASQTFTFTVPITQEIVHAKGSVYGDANGNGVPDGGEQLGGAKLTLRYTHGSGEYTATSDAQGKFGVDIPAGDYYLGGDVVDGWLFPFRTVHIGPDSDDLLVRGAPPLNGALKASMKFTQDSYRVGDLLHLTVTLSNSGSIPLTGIVAECNRVGDSYILNGTGPGWGDLVYSRGVTIAAGETRTFDVTDTVPAAAFNRGFVFASCDFGYPEVDVDNHAQADAQAAVPGAKVTVDGNVGVFDDHGQLQRGVAGVKVVLVSDLHCPITGETTTDDKGYFAFKDVAPGPAYQLYFQLPDGWKLKYDDSNPMPIWVFGAPTKPQPQVVLAEEGTSPAAPAVPAQPADCAPAGTPTSSNAAGTGGGESTGGGTGLASTGVDALGLGVLALVALGLGGGLVIGSRRRRNAA